MPRPVTIVIAIPVPELDNFQRFRIDLSLERPAVLIGAPDFVTAVVDLDPGDGPPSPGGHRLYGLTRLPSVH